MFVSSRRAGGAGDLTTGADNRMREQRPIHGLAGLPRPPAINMQPATVHILGSPREEYQYSCFDIPIKRGRFVYELVRPRRCARRALRLFACGASARAHRRVPTLFTLPLLAIPFEFSIFPWIFSLAL